MPQRDAACREAGPERREQRTRRQALGTGAFEDKENGRGRHVAASRDDVAFVIERALILCDAGTFSVDETWLRPKSPQLTGRPVSRHGVLAEDKKEFADRERKTIEAALAECQGRVSGSRGAAAILGIPHQTLESKIVSLGIDKGRFKAEPSKRRSD